MRALQPVVCRGCLARSVGTLIPPIDHAGGTTQVEPGTTPLEAGARPLEIPFGNDADTIPAPAAPPRVEEARQDQPGVGLIHADERIGHALDRRGLVRAARRPPAHEVLMADTGRRVDDADIGRHPFRLAVRRDRRVDQAGEHAIAQLVHGERPRRPVQARHVADQAAGRHIVHADARHTADEEAARPIVDGQARDGGASRRLQDPDRADAPPGRRVDDRHGGAGPVRDEGAVGGGIDHQARHGRGDGQRSDQRARRAIKGAQVRPGAARGRAPGIEQEHALIRRIDGERQRAFGDGRGPDGGPRGEIDDVESSRRPRHRIDDKRAPAPPVDREQLGAASARQRPHDAPLGQVVGRQRGRRRGRHVVEHEGPLRHLVDDDLGRLFGVGDREDVAGRPGGRVDGPEGGRVGGLHKGGPRGLMDPDHAGRGRRAAGWDDLHGGSRGARAIARGIGPHQGDRDEGQRADTNSSSHGYAPFGTARR